jgi:hypothetical protein
LKVEKWELRAESLGPNQQISLESTRSSQAVEDKLFEQLCSKSVYINFFRRNGDSNEVQE